VYTLFFSVSHGTFRCGVLLNIYDNSSFIESQFSHVLLFCVVFSKRYLFCCLWCVWSFFSLLHPAVFDSASAFNQDVSNWNTGAVTDMRYMFESASVFNQDVSKWNTGAVTTIDGMFRGASAFNQDVSKWNTGAVTTMEEMFSNAENFNQDVSKWNTGAVTTMYRSKCTLSLLSISVLWPRRFPLWCVVEDIYDSSRFVGSHVSHVLFLFLVVV
jgi:surface protein